MAERRMFAKTIVLSDAFLDMPATARCLYFTLGMFADDDGFINSPKGIIRQCGASEDDLKILIAKKFLIPFESGVVVIKHWRIHNYIQKDRYHETKYIVEKSMLSVDENNSYTTNVSRLDTTWIQDGYNMDTGCIQDVSKMDTEVRLGKDRIGKDRIGSTPKKTRNVIPPTMEMINSYIKEKGLSVNGEKFYLFYNSKGWRVGKDKMKDWQSAIRGWEVREKEQREEREVNPFTGLLTDDEERSD